jgi:hypothetical protein
MCEAKHAPASIRKSAQTAACLRRKARPFSG